MCGIAGIVNLLPGEPPSEAQLLRMLGAIRHRGPDEFGILLDAHAGLGNARLKIVDLAAGQQPIGNEDKDLWIVFNGEVFNHVEIREELERRGHRFATRCDTEVVLHAFEEYGPDCLLRFNGQFAIAIWNIRERSLFLARDRWGKRPLMFTQVGGTLRFASEIKAILAPGGITTRLDPAVVDQVLSFWCPLRGMTAFEGIRELPPGHYLVADRRGVTLRSYWSLDFEGAADDACGSRDGELIGEFRRLMEESARIRLRADVPVGAYLSGGLDSSVIAALVRREVGGALRTFSIAFEDEHFDESVHQRRMADHLGTEHQTVWARREDIASVFPDVIWHTEVPVTRTAPAPMFLLSREVHRSGFKVVLTGEGADEFLGGYDLFKEAAVRRFWARRPGSRFRPALLRRLYPDIPALANAGSSFAEAFFGADLTSTSHPHYSHLVRWRNNRRIRRFLTPEAAAAGAATLEASLAQISLPEGYDRWSPLQKGQFLEADIFLSQYLLSSQGDRMAMAHSVECRHPFLDPHVVEFCNRLPDRMKLRGLQDKVVLRKLAKDLIPEEILSRRKRPYRAPIHRCFTGVGAPEYVRSLLSPKSLREVGIFHPEAVVALLRKLDSGGPCGETDDMALAAILSTQILHERFVRCPDWPSPITQHDRIKLVQIPQSASETRQPSSV